MGKKQIRLTVTIIFLLVLGKLSGQHELQFLENLNSDEQIINIDAQLENYEYLLTHPLELNKADQSELRDSELFSPNQILALQHHIETTGPLLTLYELQCIPHFDLNFIQAILPYISLNNSIDDYHLKFGKLISKGEYQLFLRYHQSFPKKQAYTTNAYLGNPSNIYSRFKYNYSNRLYYGITMEKDAGEPFFRANNKLGFDFYSYHFFWRINSKIKAIALGDYHVNFGQGLTIWTGFGFGKSGMINAIKKEANTLKPYTSLNELTFLRGSAIQLQFKSLQFSAFVSRKKLDANILYEDSLEQEIASNSIQSSGYHRSSQEIAKKHRLAETLVGLNIQFRQARKSIGVNTIFSHYKEDLQPSLRAYNQFYFRDHQLSNTSLDYHFLLKSFHFFGESAISISPSQFGFASLNGLLFNPDKAIDIALLHRYFHPKYQSSIYANAFAESGQLNNEHGLYLGLNAHITKKITLSTYLDYYHFPWLKYSADKPSKGQDFSFQLLYKIKNKLETYISYKRETKEANVKIDLGLNESFYISASSRPYLDAYFTHIDLSQVSSLRPSNELSKQAIEAATFIVPILQQKLRFHISSKLNKAWTLQTRLEFSFYKDQINKAQRGVLFYQDLKFNKMEVPFSFSARIALFDIPQYNSRIYAYENDVLNAFSIPAMYHAGLRYYFNLQYKLNKHLSLWLRFSHTYYSDITTKGSGNDEILQNRIYDIKMQLRLKF